MHRLVFCKTVFLPVKEKILDNQVATFLFKSLLLAGIGNPPGNMDMKAFLLQKFSSTERKQVINISIFSHAYLRTRESFQKHETLFICPSLSFLQPNSFTISLSCFICSYKSMKLH